MNPDANGIADWCRILTQSGAQELRGSELNIRETVAPGWAGHFGDVVQEYHALTRHCGIIDFSSRTQLEISGGDRQSFLHNFSTAHVKRLQPGEGTEAFITSVQGKTLGFVYVFCGSSSLILETVPDQASTLLCHLDRYHITEDVELADRSEAWAELLVAGPASHERLAAMISAPLPADYLGHVDLVWDGVPVCIRKVHFTASGGYLLSVSREQLAQLWQRFTASKNPAAPQPVGNAAFNIARIEAGTPWFGVDLTDRNLPQELNRDRLAISFTKGCYLGQETVARIDALGHVNQSLCGLVFEASVVPPVGATLEHDGKSLGTITSAVFSPALGKPLALAYVKRGFNQLGTELSTPWGQAKTVDLPLPECS